MYQDRIMYQSNLYGIEIRFGFSFSVEGFEYQSNLYGIEIQISELWQTETEVPIEPLWNWNRKTFPKQSRLWSTNRTFMELKSGQAPHPVPQPAVPIEPLWNWNHPPQIKKARWNMYQSNLYGIEIKKQKASVFHRYVPIEPLWNWNADCRRLFWQRD